MGQPDQVSLVSQFARTIWDAFTWDAFFWDGRTLLPSEVELEGTGTNISLKIFSSSDYFLPHKLSGAVVHFTPRRALH